DLASATAINPGTTISGALNPGNASTLYRIDASAGDRFYFDEHSQSGGTVYWRLIDPYGRQVWFNGFGDVDTQALAFTGTYTLLIEGSIFNSSAPSNYSFNVQKVTDTTAALTLGTQVNGAITQAGQQNRYAFSLASDAQLYFDSLTNGSRLRWRL